MEAIKILVDQTHSEPIQPGFQTHLTLI
jgi:hypothetical protein